MEFLSRFNPVPQFPAYKGPFNVASFDVEIPVSSLIDASTRTPESAASISTVQFRVFYPTSRKEPLSSTSTQDTPGTVELDNEEIEKEATDAKGVAGWAASWFTHHAPPSEPVPSPATPTKPVYWLPEPHQREYLSGYARFLGAGSGLAELISYIPRILYHIALPVVESAPLITTPAEYKFPTMIFSHGLGGTRLAYSHICGSMAANGLVVIVPEHRDGSCPVTFIQDSSEPSDDTKVTGEKPKGGPGVTEATVKPKPRERTQVEYQRYPHIVSRRTAEGRNRQLDIRTWELSLIYSAIARIDAGDIPASTAMFEADTPKRDSLLGELADKLDIRTPGRLILSGHSFGGATMMHLMKTVYYESQIPKVEPPIFIPASTSWSGTIVPLDKQLTGQTPLYLLDLWCLPMLSKHFHPLWRFPLPQIEENNAKGILLVMSEEFFVWKENMRCVRRVLGREPGRVRGTPEHKNFEMWDTLEGAPASEEREPEDDDPCLSTGDQIVTDAGKSGASTPRGNGESALYPRMYYVIGAAHLSQSDFGVLFPRAVKTGVKHEETLDLNVRAVCQWLREYSRLDSEKDADIFEGTADRWVKIENDPV